MLGDLEAEIMDLIWERPADHGTTVRDIFEILHDRRRLAYTTVMTTMARLAKKNLLRAETRNQAYVYYPNFTEQEFTARFVGRVLDDLLVRFTGPVERGETTTDPAVAERVHRLLDEIARRRDIEER